MDYIAFISYRHKPLDAAVAKRIQKSIENYVVPKEFRDKTGGRRLGKVFRDEDELPASANLSDSITHALDNAQYLIVICTPDLPRSHWCEEEIRYFLKTHDRDHLLAVLADGEPEASFSPYMLHTFDDEGNITGNMEPLAANLKQPYKKEFIRLCAAILDCSFDSLWQRDRRKRANLCMGISAGAALLLAAFTMVVLIKNNQINEQKRLSEKRLSEALVKTGQSKLDAYDWKGALADALAAMDIDDTSSIDPHVDLLLAKSLEAYEVNTAQSEIYYEHSADIVDLKTSDDGTCLIAVDMFGRINCIDRMTGTLLWEYDTDDAWAQVYTKSLGQKVLYKTNQSVCCLSLKDGHELWSYRPEYNLPFQTLSHNGKWFAIMDRIPDEGTLVDKNSPLFLLLLNTEDGSVYARVSLTHETYLDEKTNYENLSEQRGAFSENDRQLIVSVRMEDPEKAYGDPEYDLHVFYAIDLLTLERKQIGRSSFLQDLYYGLDIDDDASQAFLAFQSTPHGGIIAVQCLIGAEKTDFDIQVINHDISAEETGTSYGYYGQYPRFHMLSGSDLYIIASDNRLLLIRKRDNKLIKTYGLDEGIIRSIEWKNEEERTIEVVTSKGYMINIPFRDPDGDGRVMLPVHAVSLAQKDICLACSVDEGLSDPNAEGCYYTISETAPGTILRSFYHSDPHMTTIYQNTGEPNYFNRFEFLPGSPWLVGLGGNTPSIRDTVYIINTETLQTKQYQNKDIPDFDLVMDPEHVLSGNQIYALTDGTTETYIEPVITEDGLPITPSHHERLNSGEILSYAERFDLPDTVYTIWKDKELLDQDLITQGSDIRSLYIVPSGWMVSYGVAGVSNEGDILWEDAPSFQCLNILTGKRTQIYENLPKGDDYLIATGHISDCMASAEADGHVYVFDLDDAVSRPVSDAYAQDGVSAIGYSADDRYLLILTKLGRLDIYRTDTLEIVYSDKIEIVQNEIRESYKQGRYIAQINSINAYSKDGFLEVCFSHNQNINACILLDQEYWVLDAELPNAEYVDPQNGEIYYWDGDAQTMYTLPLYSRQDLKTWAEEELQK